MAVAGGPRGVQRHAVSSLWLVASEAARRLDGEDLAEVEIGNRLESFAGGAVAGCVGQGIQPGGVFGLQGDQLGHRSVPALWPARAMPAGDPVSARSGGFICIQERLRSSIWSVSK